MKKLVLLVAAIFSGVGANVFAEMYKYPEANTSQPAFIEYGGTKYATGSFTISFVTATVLITTNSVIPTIGKGAVLQDVYFSSGVNTDFLDVWDATAVVNLSANTPLAPLVWGLKTEAHPPVYIALPVEKR